MHFDQAYHRVRAKQCQQMADRAADADVRRRHQQLAELHARCVDAASAGAERVA